MLWQNWPASACRHTYSPVDWHAAPTMLPHSGVVWFGIYHTTGIFPVPTHVEQITMQSEATSN